MEVKFNQLINADVRDQIRASRVKVLREVPIEELSGQAV